MKKICLLLMILLCLAACGGGGDNDGDDESRIRELDVDETVTGKIETVGDVDWYHVHAVENDRVLSVNLQGTRKNSPVDFMLTIYEKDANGNFVTIFGESAKEEVMAEANITINIPVDGSRHLYLVVRDFKDDEASDLVSYRLRATFAGEVEDNSTFENAIELPVEDGQVCLTDESIFPASDVDCYRFAIGGDNPAGVYRISAQYLLSQGTPMPVTLDLELYDSDGQIVQQFKGEKPAEHLYVLLPYLEEGTYFLVVAAQGRTTESEQTYSLCIEPVDAEEVMENDTSDQDDVDALTMEIVPGEDAERCIVTGSLEYIQDEDWYMVNVESSPGESKNIILNLFHNFDGQVPAALQAQTKPAQYRITVLEETGSGLNSIYSYDHSILAAEPNIVEIGAGSGTNNYIMVKPIYNDQLLMALPYQLEVTLRDYNDPNEQEDPITLTSGVAVTGKIAKLGDKDDYEISVNADTAPKILEVFFNTQEQSEVSYAVIIQWNGKSRMIRDTNGVSEGVECKSSFLILESGDVDLQVLDEQNNDGDDTDYTLMARIVDIPTDLTGTTPPSGDVSSPVYFSEDNENSDNDATTVTVIEYDNEIRPEFQANTDELRVLGPLNNGDTWSSDWIAGYVDYDGDRDLFELNFDAITEGVDTWYFDIEIQMVARGSEVEYSWTLFRDAAPANNVLVERMYLENVGTDFEFEHFPEGGGIIASWADIDHEETVNTIDVTIPADAPDDPDDETDTLFWIGKDSVGSKFYLSVNDFDRAVLSRTWDDENETWIPTPNPVPDNDWGNPASFSQRPDYTTSSAVQPYYFRVTVTYHDDRGCPEPYQCD